MARFYDPRVRLVGGIVATIVLAYVAFKLWYEGHEELCSGKDTLRCSDEVVRVGGVALWPLLGLLVVLGVVAVARMARWWREQRSFR